MLGRRQQRTTRASDLTDDDRRRIERAVGGSRVDMSAGLYSPSGMVRRVNREAVLLAGGGRALLMQIAHPLVAAGVARHSGFERDPLGRLWRTLDLTLTIVFGDAASAVTAVKRIEKLHSVVRGHLTESVGPFDARSTYDATDPALLFWVHATLIDSALSTYDRFVRPLDEHERLAFFEESKTTARLFGVPEEHIPADANEFDRYMRGMLAGDTLTIGDDARRVASSIMDPPLPAGLRQIAGSGRIFTEGMLPAELRQRFGYSWNHSRQRNLERAQAFSRRVLPYLPARARYFPHALRAGGPSGEPRSVK